MPSQALTIPAIEETIVIPASAFATRDKALAKSKEVRAVFDDASRDKALESIRTLKELRLQMDKFREFAKAPITAAGKKVEQIVADFSREIGCGSGEAKQGPEENRLLALIRHHESQLRLQREADARKREQEQARAAEAERERQREILRRENEVRRKQEEALAALERAERARTDAGRQKASAEAEKARQQATAAQEEAEKLAMEAEQADVERLQREQDDKERQAALAIPIPGMKEKPVWDFEIVNDTAFAFDHPELCKIEVRRRETLEAIEAGVFDVPINPETQTLAGSVSLAGDGWKECQKDEKTFRTGKGIRIFKKLKLNVS